MESGSRGFTLVETLAALAVAAAIIVGAATLIHHVAHYFDRGLRGVDEAERFALAMDRLARDFEAASFVPTTLGEAAPPAEAKADAAKGRKKRPAPKVAFDGAPARIVFVTASAIGARASPEEIVTLAVETRRDGGARLLRRRAPWLGPRAGVFAGEGGDAVVLLEGDYDISFRFARVDDRGVATWSGHWRDETEPPRLVRLELRDARTGASLLAGADFVLRVDAPLGCAGGRAECLPGADKESPDEKKPEAAREPT